MPRKKLLIATHANHVLVIGEGLVDRIKPSVSIARLLVNWQRGAGTWRFAGELYLTSCGALRCSCHPTKLSFGILGELVSFFEFVGDAGG